MRALAHRTQQSTLEIDKMVTTMRSGSTEAVESMSISRSRATETLGLAQGAGESVTRITTSINEISERNLVIASAAEEQAQVAREQAKNGPFHLIHLPVATLGLHDSPRLIIPGGPNLPTR